jgi:ferrochelatase
MAVTTRRRVAVVLFNLGGPDSLKAVRPFLFNLFADPAIIGAPAAVRYPLAALISTTRARSARANYAVMGGASPLLAETDAQARALEAALAERMDGAEAKVFIAMRYWRPFVAETAQAVAAYAPDDIVLLPLYPQFSTTTTGSSLAAWSAAYRGGGVVKAVCCYPALDELAAAHAARIEEAWAAAGRPPNLCLLFSAHGLPEKVVDAGDPYAEQVEAVARAVAGRLDPGLSDWRICYQSRVGPLKWLGPSTVEAIEALGADGRGVLISPIAFVSEHVETLVELDRDYAELAQAAGCAPYLRAPALGVQAAFIAGLADVAARALASNAAVAPGSSFRCGARWSKCPRLAEEARG